MVAMKDKCKFIKQLNGIFNSIGSAEKVNLKNITAEFSSSVRKGNPGSPLSRSSQSLEFSWVISVSPAALNTVWNSSCP
jgi:hypothetical protein